MKYIKNKTIIKNTQKEINTVTNSDRKTHKLKYKKAAVKNCYFDQLHKTCTSQNKQTKNESDNDGRSHLKQGAVKRRKSEWQRRDVNIKYYICRKY